MPALRSRRLGALLIDALPAFGPPFATAWALSAWSGALSDLAVLVLGLWSGLVVRARAAVRQAPARPHGVRADGPAPPAARHVFVDRERRALHDLAAGTVVLEPKREAQTLVRIRLLPPELRRRVAREAYERAGVPPQELIAAQDRELDARERSLAAAEAQAHALHSPP